jgi:hypothetical protein
MYISDRRPGSARYGGGSSKGSTTQDSPKSNLSGIVGATNQSVVSGSSAFEEHLNSNNQESQNNDDDEEVNLQEDIPQEIQNEL